MIRNKDWNLTIENNSNCSQKVKRSSSVSTVLQFVKSSNTCWIPKHSQSYAATCNHSFLLRSLLHFQSTSIIIRHALTAGLAYFVTEVLVHKYIVVNGTSAPLYKYL